MDVERLLTTTRSARRSLDVDAPVDLEASKVKEGFIGFLLVSSSVAIVIGVVIVLIGL